MLETLRTYPDLQIVTNMPLKFEGWVPELRARLSLLAPHEWSSLQEDREKFGLGRRTPSASSSIGLRRLFGEQTDTVFYFDEAHELFAKSDSRFWRSQCGLFCGTLRKRNCSVVFISQNAAKLAKEVLDEAEVKIETQHARQTFVAPFGWCLDDVRQLMASWVGFYEPQVYEHIWAHAQGRWKRERTKTFVLGRSGFALYESSVHGDSGGVSESEVWQRGRLWVTFWFIRRNSWPLVWRLLVLAGLALGCAKIPYLMTYFQRGLLGVVSPAASRSADGAGSTSVVVGVSSSSRAPSALPGGLVPPSSAPAPVAPYSVLWSPGSSVRPRWVADPVAKRGVLAVPSGSRRQVGPPRSGS
jgi:hypothetical protein